MLRNDGNEGKRNMDKKQKTKKTIPAIGTKKQHNRKDKADTFLCVGGHSTAYPEKMVFP